MSSPSHRRPSGLADIGSRRPTATPARPASKASRDDLYTPTRLPGPLIALAALLILVPVEVSLRAGSIFVPWYRFFLVLFAIPVLMRTFSGKIQLKAFDWCIIIQGAWVLLCELIKRSAGGVQPGAVYFLETTIVYLVARTYMDARGHLISFPRQLALLMVIPIILAIPEAMFFHTRYIHDFARSLTGYYYWFQEDYRLGMLRAASLFEHPILFGLFCSCLLSLIWASAKKAGVGVFWMIVLSFGVFLSASSAPILTLILQIFLLMFERATRGIPARFQFLMFALVFAFVFLSITSNRGPIGIIATSFTLNAQSGYYRLLIWEHGIDDVLGSPLIGIRQEEWTRPGWMTPSIDNNWLLVAMKGGIPTVVLIFAAMWLIWRALYRQPKVHLSFERLRLGWSLTALALLLGGATVAYFGKMQPFFFLLLGYGGALWQLGQKTSEPASAPNGRRNRNLARNQSQTTP